MKKVIEKYKKFIFIYVLVNLFALGVNLIDLNFYSHTKGSSLNFYYLTNNEKLSNNLDHFWPFVKFVENRDQFYSYGTHDYDYTNFNGIFYHYDISEFIFYIALLFAVLFYKSYIQEKKIAVPIQDAAKN